MTPYDFDQIFFKYKISCSSAICGITDDIPTMQEGKT